MRVPAWVLVTGAVVAAFPFGWGLGVLVAYVVTAERIGQLPALTVPLAIIGAIGFAVSPWLTPGMRLTVLLVGTGGAFRNRRRLKRQIVRRAYRNHSASVVATGGAA